MATEVTETPVDRRHLLRGGAVLAGAAGIAALGAVAAPSASATDGAAVLQGRDNEGTATTTIGIGPEGTGNQTNAALALGNDDGPSLALQPLGADWQGDLEEGQIANTVIGPYIGLDDYNGELSTGWLVTNFDLGAVPVAVAVTPQRVADTRTADGREGILATSPNAFDSQHRLVAGAWMDVAVTNADSDYSVESVFVNLTVTGPLAPGFLKLYVPGTEKPPTSNLNYATGQIICNGSFVPAGVVDTYYAVRIFTSKTTHVVVDLTGLTISDVPGPAGTLNRQATKQVRRSRAARRPMSSVGRKARR